jgi:translation initiation factor IF-1
MVRNTHGGNKSKGMARKNVQSNSAGPSAQLRHPTDEFEQIALVTRVLGNGMFYANNTLGIQLLGHIRNKFKGRSRRNNDVSVGKLVLIGLRSWESTPKNADLLFVYEDHDFATLSSKFDLSLFSSSYSSSSTSSSSNHEYIFSDNISHDNPIISHHHDILHIDNIDDI